MWETAFVSRVLRVWGVDLRAVDDRAPGNDEGRDEVLLERYSLATGGQSGECSGVDRARSRPCSLSS